MAKILKKGYLDSIACSDVTNGVVYTRLWEEQFFVLYDTTAEGQGRFASYPDNATFESAGVYRGFYLEELEYARMGGLDTTLGFHVHTKRHGTMHYKVKNKSEAKAWCNLLESKIQECKKSRLVKNSGKIVQTFPVKSERCEVDNNDSLKEHAVVDFTVMVESTEAAERCRLSSAQTYLLRVGSRCVELAQQNTKQPIFQWPYTVIRRYGQSPASFSVEAGRRSGSGPGTFTFLTQKAGVILNMILDHGTRFKGTPPGGGTSRLSNGVYLRTDGGEAGGPEGSQPQLTLGEYLTTTSAVANGSQDNPYEEILR